MTKIDVLTELREQQRVRPRSYSSDLAQRAADEIERLRWWNADMVAKAASGGTLDGYREMGARLAALEAERDRLREALEWYEAHVAALEAERDRLWAEKYEAAQDADTLLQAEQTYKRLYRDERYKALALAKERDRLREALWQIIDGATEYTRTECAIASAALEGGGDG